MREIVKRETIETSIAASVQRSVGWLSLRGL